MPHVHQVAQLGAPVLQVGRVDHACMCRGEAGQLNNGSACKCKHIWEDWARTAQLGATVQLVGVFNNTYMSRAKAVSASTYSSLVVLADTSNLGRDTCIAGTPVLQVGRIHHTWLCKCQLPLIMQLCIACQGTVLEGAGAFACKLETPGACGHCVAQLGPHVLGFSSTPACSVIEAEERQRCRQ